jgi:hypothetical protein
LPFNSRSRRALALLLRSRWLRALLAPAAVAAGVLACDQGTEPDHNHPPGGGFCGHIDGAGGVVLVTHGDSLVRQFGSLVHGIHVTFLDEQGNNIDIAEDCTINHLEWSVGNPDLVDITQDPGVRWYFNVVGVLPGTTTMTVSPAHLTHSHFTSLEIPLVVLPQTD